MTKAPQPSFIMLTKYDTYASRSGMHQRRRMMKGWWGERVWVVWWEKGRQTENWASSTIFVQCAVPEMFPFSTFSIPGRWCCWLCRRCNTVWEIWMISFMMVIGGPWWRWLEELCRTWIASPGLTSSRRSANKNIWAEQGICLKN